MRKSKFITLCLIGTIIFSCKKDVNLKKQQPETPGVKLSTQGLPSTPRAGANYNETFQIINYPDLAATNTVWVRGIINFLDFYNAWKTNPSTWYNDAPGKMSAFLDIKNHGSYKTIVNIRFDFGFRSLNIPAKSTDPNSDFRQMLDTFLPILLDKIMPATDIIVVGNEPFIETLVSDRGQKLMDFYNKAATRTNTYKVNKGVTTPLFIGAFDNVYDHTTDPNRVALLQMAHDSAWVAGADVHIHCNTITELNTSMSTIANGLRNTSHPYGGQNIIVTEYSLKPLFMDHETDAIPSSFNTTWGINSSVNQLYKYIDLAINPTNPYYTGPRPLAEWDDFNSKMSVLENNKHWIRDSFDNMDNYPKFVISTTAVEQGASTSFPNGTPPWILNPLYVNTTVQHKVDGSPNVRYTYYNDYLALAH